MFLSHIFSFLCFALLIVMICLFGETRGFIRIFIEVAGIGLIYAGYKFSRADWIWIGPTIGQMESELEHVSRRATELEGIIFPEFGAKEFTPPPNTKELQTERRKLIARQAKLQEMIRSQASGVAGRG
jgi:hypothetical protein